MIQAHIAWAGLTLGDPIDLSTPYGFDQAVDWIEKSAPDHADELIEVLNEQIAIGSRRVAADEKKATSSSTRFQILFLGLIEIFRSKNSAHTLPSKINDSQKMGYEVCHADHQSRKFRCLRPKTVIRRHRRVSNFISIPVPQITGSGRTLQRSGTCPKVSRGGKLSFSFSQWKVRVGKSNVYTDWVIRPEPETDEEVPQAESPRVSLPEKDSTSKNPANPNAEIVTPTHSSSDLSTPPVSVTPVEKAPQVEDPCAGKKRLLAEIRQFEEKIRKDQIQLELEQGKVSLNERHALFSLPPQEKKEVVYLLDVSGSVWEKTPEGYTYAEIAYETLKRLIPHLPADTRYQIVFVGEKVSLGFNDFQSGPWAIQTLPRFQVDQKKRFIFHEPIPYTTSNPQRSIYENFTAAIEAFEGKHPLHSAVQRTYVVASDFNWEAREYREFLTRYQDPRRHFVIHGFGRMGDSSYFRFFKYSNPKFTGEFRSQAHSDYFYALDQVSNLRSRLRKNEKLLKQKKEKFSAFKECP